ncbi:MAG TPA: FAD-dependent oxidoreductase [Anaerolineales bacterium]|nr:FAD-dependent oxidoreductase [Anaerolineales bacterium]
MAKFKYLMIGAGMTADAAVRGIRELDPDGTIGMIGSDQNPPYNRPPLTKALWKGKPLESIWRGTQEYSVEFHLGRTAVSIDTDKKEVMDDHGADYKYEKLLLATGGTPRKLPFGAGNIIYYRTLDDYQYLRELSNQREHFGVIGAGFIGSELAAALSMNGKKVTMLFPDAGIGAHIYPKELSEYLNGFFRQKGVEVIPGVQVTDLQKMDGSFQLITDVGKKVQVDGVIAGIGIQPNVDLAKSAGLKIGNGIAVDDTLHTSRPDIYAAGDVAEFANPALGKRLRIEHEDNANSMGKQAGRNMAGANEPYNHLSYFYSDLFELGYEAVGELDARLEIFIDWKEPFKKGVIYYLKEGRVRGVLLWNVWDTVQKARELIAEPGPFTPADLKGRL